MARGPRLTIAALIGVVAFCAVTLAALRTSSPYWASAMVSLTVVVLLGSVVASLWGRRLRPLVGVRDLWLGLLRPDLWLAVS